MRKVLSFDDVLIVPEFSRISSRKECNTYIDLNGLHLNVPIISANMDTITGSEMANAMAEFGGIGALHRFGSLQDNVNMFYNSTNCIVSVGVNEIEKDRVRSLLLSGASHWLIDIAHGASQPAVEMYQWMRDSLPEDHWICVGNFANYWSYGAFINSLKEGTPAPNAIKIGIGGGSMCTTRIVTGCGLPTLESILDFKRYDDLPPKLIADGGIKNSGDIAKALAAGADAVMIGSLLSGTDETPCIFVDKHGEKFPEDILIKAKQDFPNAIYKKYRGSASKDSYEVQGKIAEHRAPEGEATIVPYKGPVKDVLQNLKAGLQSAMSYVNASTITEFKNNAELVEITGSGMAESKPHGKK